MLDKRYRRTKSDLGYNLFFRIMCVVVVIAILLPVMLSAFFLVLQCAYPRQKVSLQCIHFGFFIFNLNNKSLL